MPRDHSPHSPWGPRSLEEPKEAKRVLVEERMKSHPLFREYLANHPFTDEELERHLSWLPPRVMPSYEEYWAFLTRKDKPTLQQVKKDDPDEYNRLLAFALLHKLASDGRLDILQALGPDVLEAAVGAVEAGRELARLGHDIEMSSELASRGIAFPGVADTKWEHLSRVVEKDPAGLTHRDIYHWALAWCDRQMLLQRRLQEKPAGHGGEGNRKKPRCPRGQAPEWILSYLCMHHKYDGEGIETWEPLKEKEIADGAKVSPARVSAWLKQEFGGHARYEADCHKRENGRLLSKLRALRGEATGGFARPEVIADAVPDRNATDVAGEWADLEETRFADDDDEV